MIMRLLFKYYFAFICLFGLFNSCNTPTKQSDRKETPRKVEIKKDIQKSHDRIDLSKYEQTNQSEKIDLMNKVKDMYPQYSESAKWPYEYLRYFHFFDLDSDGDKDLIYDGWSGGEPMMVQISLKIGEDYKTAITDYAKLIDINHSNNTLTGFTINDPGCCGAIMEHDIKYECKAFEDSLDFWITDHTTYHFDIPRPKKYYDTVIKFEVINTPYTLRVTPEIDTSGFFDYDDTKGNVMKTYAKGDIGYAFAEQEDKTGRVWWFVVMESDLKMDKKVTNRDEFEPDYIGWMSSRYLKRLN